MATGKKVFSTGETDRSVGAQVRKRGGKGREPMPVLKLGGEMAGQKLADIADGMGEVNAVGLVLGGPLLVKKGAFTGIGYHDIDDFTLPEYDAVFYWNTGRFEIYEAGKFREAWAEVPDLRVYISATGRVYPTEAAAKADKGPTRAPAPAPAAPKKEAPKKVALGKELTMEDAALSRGERDYEWQKDGNRFVPVHKVCGGDVDFDSGICARCESKVKGWKTREEKEAERQQPSRREQPAPRAPAPTQTGKPAVDMAFVAKMAEALANVPADNRQLLLAGQPQEVVSAVEKAISDREEALKPVVAEVQLGPEIPAGAAVKQVKEFGTNNIPCTLVEMAPDGMVGNELAAWKAFTERSDIVTAAALMGNDFARLLEITQKRGTYMVLFPRVIKTAAPIPRADADAWAALKQDPNTIAELMNGDAAPDRLLNLLTIQTVTEEVKPVKMYPNGLTTPETAHWAYAQEGHSVQEVAAKMGGNPKGDAVDWLKALVAAQRICQAEAVEEPIEVTPADFGFGVKAGKPVSSVKPDAVQEEQVFGQFPWAASDALRPLAEELGWPMKDSQRIRDLAGYAADNEMPTGKAQKGLSVVAALIKVGRLTVDGIVEAWQEKRLGEYITASTKQAEAVSLFMDIASKLAAEHPAAAAQPAEASTVKFDFSSLSVEEMKKRVRFALKDAADQKYAREHFAGFSSAKKEDLVKMLEAWAKVLAAA